MKFEYQITTKRCPYCHNIIEKHNDFFIRLLLFIILPFWLLYTLCRFLFQRFLLNVIIPQVGETYITCPHCGKNIRTDEKTYDELTDREKNIYDHGNLFRFTFVISGITPIIFPFCFFVNATDVQSMTVGILSICFTVIFVIFMTITVIWWHASGQYHSTNASHVSQKPIKKDFFDSDYQLSYKPKIQQEPNTDTFESNGKENKNNST